MCLRCSFRLAGLAAALLLVESSAFADVLPGSVYPEQLAKTLTPKPREVSSGAAPERVVEQQKQVAGISPEAKKIKFKLNAIILVGNHVIPKEKLVQIYKKEIGKTITVADLFEIVQNITNYYRNNGYIISRAILPPHHVENGEVKIEVIEGYIDKVTVTGKPRGAKCIIEGFGYQIRKCPPLNLNQLEKYMLLVNEIP